MPQVLTTNAIITCPHGGTGRSVSKKPYWTADGGVVLVENDTGVLTCPFIHPCLGYRLQSMGLNSTYIESERVILATDFNQTFSGLPLIITETNQVVDDTTPTPIQSGQPPPPLAPELTDQTQPSITAAPKVVTFNLKTMQPATFVVAFNLSSTYPLKWILTLINGVILKDFNVTTSQPPGLVVAPSGGQWRSPNLTVTLTLTAPFMAMLGEGTHYFYMTGVSKRGLPGFAEVKLTVS